MLRSSTVLYCWKVDTESGSLLSLLSYLIWLKSHPRHIIMANVKMEPLLLPRPWTLCKWQYNFVIVVFIENIPGNGIPSHVIDNSTILAVKIHWIVFCQPQFNVDQKYSEGINLGVTLAPHKWLKTQFVPFQHKFEHENLTGHHGHSQEIIRLCAASSEV